MRTAFLFPGLLACLMLSSVAHADQIDNPIYTAWAKCKPGTTVTIKQVADSQPGQKLEMEFVDKLITVKPDSITIESTMKAKLPDGTWLESGAQTKTIPAKIEKGREFLDLGGDFNVAISDLKEGKEVIDVKGVKVDATTRSFTATVVDGRGRAIRGGRGQMAIKARLWLSPAVPGGLVKSEQTSVQPGMEDRTTAKTLVEYNIAK